MEGNDSNHVLIVDDSADMVVLLRQLLEEEGYIVDVAMNGKDALDFLRSAVDLPAVILLDLMMPVMDGYQFRAEQEKDARLGPIPIVVMTADGNIESKEIKIGANASIKKPMDINSVLAIVKRFSIPKPPFSPIQRSVKFDSFYIVQKRIPPVVLM